MRTSYHPDLRYHGKAWPVCKDRHKNGRAKGASASQWKYMPLLLLSEQNLGNCQWLQIGLLDMPFICKSVHPTTAFTNSINPTVHGWLLMHTLMGHIWVSLLFPPSIPRLLLLLVLVSCALFWRKLFSDCALKNRTDHHHQCPTEWSVSPYSVSEKGSSGLLAELVCDA